MSEEIKPQVLEYLNHASIETINTNLYKHGFRQPCLVGVMPVHSGKRRMIGEAYTVRFIPAREDINKPNDPYEKDKENLQWRAIEEAPPGSVIVVDSNRDSRASSGGDILLTRAMVRGVNGFVTDGGVRD